MSCLAHPACRRQAESSCPSITRREDGGNGYTSRPRLTAQEVLADRFARGEIAEDEYWQRLHVLRATDD
jgi:hypothetical protein